ncbi:hypothetical protein GCM10023094_41400 [Rhodococcus olei]|uniref:Major facilitator superfamily (MFS) profile domain-containing protein n=1 Tax=Rhodococcus olei TaxID=2161675 RepID=A0ABP8PGJ1_9NOCA
MTSETQLGPRPGVAHEPGSPAVGRLSLRSVVGFLAFVELVSGMVQGYYSPLLAGLASALHVGAGPLNWFNSVQLLAAAVSVPIFAALGDRVGHRRMLTVAVWAVAVGAILIVVAPSFPIVLLGRVLQGPLAAWIALEIALVRDKASGHTAHRAIGLLASSLTAGALIGGLVSGPLDGLIGDVRLTMAIPAVLAIICGFVTMFLIPESTTRASRTIDWIGAVGLSVALVLVLLGLIGAHRSGWTAPSTLGGVGLGLVVLAVWVWWERRTASPLVDMRLFTDRKMWPAMVAALLFGLSLFGNQVPIVTFLAAKPDVVGYGFGLSPRSISLVLAVNLVAAVIGSSLCARIATIIGLRGVLPLGAGTMAVGFVGLAVLHQSLAVVVGVLALTGFGVGLLLGGLPSYISEVAPAGRIGTASGTYSTVKVLGGAIATAVIGALLSSFVPAGGTAPTVTGYTVVWFACAASALVSLGVLALAWSRRRTGRRAI